MLPYEPLGVYDAQKTFPRFLIKMPRVVADQKNKFETDELFRRHSRESEVRYTAFRDRPLDERQMRFHNSCREGHLEIAFTSTGTNLSLVFLPCTNGYGKNNDIDFDKEQGKVHIKAGFIMNGVCVRWRGWLDLERLDGVGCLEYDEERGQMEDSILREQIEIYNRRLRDFEEKQRAYRAQHERRVEAEAEARKKHAEINSERSTAVRK
ncbi:CBFB (predicted) [Pycnogonum litorale]